VEEGISVSEKVAGIEIPDTRLAAEATALVREAEPPLLFDHSRRVYLFGMLQGLRRGLKPDLELLYVGAMFHDLGLTQTYRTTHQRFEIDGANEVGADDVGRVWTAIALHTTPGVPEFMEPEIALVTAGVETDVLGIGRDDLIRRRSKPSPMRTRDPTSSAGFWRPSPTASRTDPTRTLAL
jgi:HD domain